MYSLRDASTLLGCDVRTLARCLHDASISPAPGRTDRRRLELTAEQLDAVRPLVAERTQRNGPSTAPASPVRDRDGSDLAALRAEVAALRARVASLERMVRTPIAAVTRSDGNLTAQDGQGYQHTAQPPYRAPVPRPAASDHNSGDVRLGPFAALHGVARRTASDHADRGIIVAERRPDPARPTEQPYWVTPDQQRAAIEEWRRRGQLGRECSDCPH